MNVLFSFLHLGILHPPSSHLFYSCSFHMDPSSTPNISYVDGASHFFRNLALEAWAIFTTLHSLVHSNDVCIGFSTTKQVEYDEVIGFLVDSIHHHILHLYVCLDSLLLVMQLNDIYHVCNHVLFRKYLRGKILACEFESISFNHVPIEQNNYVDTITIIF